MENLKRRWPLYLALVLLAGVGYLLIPGADYEYEPAHPPPTTFEEYQARWKSPRPTKPGNEAKLIRYAEGKTDLAILYIHGFGSSRGEGQLVVDQVAEEFEANTFYIRLPGHGTNNEHLREQQWDDYVDAAEAALRAMPLLGENIIVIGTSMGGLLASHLAGAHPDRIAGLVLISPFYNFAKLPPRIMGHPLVRPIASIALGNQTRVTRKDVTAPASPQDPRRPGYEKYWYNEKRLDTYVAVAELRERLVQRDMFARITMPVLLLYYYRDEDNQDPSVSVRAMLDHFAQMGRSPDGRARPAGHPLNRAVAVENGAHVMTSAYVLADTETPRSEIEQFIKDVQAELDDAPATPNAR